MLAGLRPVSMGKPYSLDLRKRVVAAIEGGCPAIRAAKQFGVAISTAISWMKRLMRPVVSSPARSAATSRRQFRVSTQFGCRSGSRTAISPYAVSLLSLAGCGLKVDYHSVWDFVHAEKFSFKKSVAAGERDRPEVARRRAQWAKYQDRVKAERLVFIDETWTKTDMALAGMGAAREQTSHKVLMAAGRP